MTGTGEGSIGARSDARWRIADASANEIDSRRRPFDEVRAMTWRSESDLPSSSTSQPVRTDELERRPISRRLGETFDS